MVCAVSWLVAIPFSSTTVSRANRTPSRLKIYLDEVGYKSKHVILYVDYIRLYMKNKQL